MKEEREVLKDTDTGRKLLLGAKKLTESLDFAFQPRTPDLEIVALGTRLFELAFEVVHLVNALLTIAAGGYCVGFPLFHT
jgi:hypothetical protein